MTGAGYAARRLPWARALGTINAGLSTIRPADTGMVIVGSLIGARVADPDLLSTGMIAAIALSNGLLCAGSMAYNDWRDVEADAINRPGRALVSGRIRRASVLQLAVTLFALGLLTALMGGPRFAAAGVALVAASVLYTERLKTIPLVGNVTVAAVMSYPLWCWLLGGAALSLGYVAVCLSVLSFRVGAEIIKTAEDWRGDEASGLDTVATRRGARAALWLGCAGLLTAAAFAWAAAYIHRPGAIALLAFAVGTGLILTACVWTGRNRRPPEATARAMVQLVRVITVVVAAGLAVGFA